MKHLLILLVFAILLFSMNLSSAELQGVTQGECVNIRTQSNYSSINLSTITVGSQTIVINTEMENLAGNTFNYTYCNTYTLGTYVYDWFPCDSSESCVNSFTVTPSGNTGTANIVFFIFVIVLIYAFTFTSFFGRNIPLTILGGMAMIFLGVYLVNNGIIIFRDNLTLYVGYLTSAAGFIMAAWAFLEQLEVL